MKIRNDYVSNSSSSSFIVIESDSGTDETERIKKTYSDYSESYPYVFPNIDHKHQFGWEFENTSDFGGKMNFAGIQLLYLYSNKLEGGVHPKYDFDILYEMLKKVCREQFGFAIELDTSIVKKDSWTDDKGEKHIMWELVWDFYIDHQSAVTENECMEMFESEQALIDFLSNGNSYIKGGNDNE